MSFEKEHINQSLPGAQQVDYLIVGQGLCGTFLSWYLQKEGKRVLVIDEDAPDTASKVAAGIINPVTGRRYVASWIIEDLIPFCTAAYEELGKELDTKLIFQKDVIEFFPTPQMRDAFVNRVAADDTYLKSYPDQNHFNQYFNYDFGCGEVRPVFMVSIQLALAAWRKNLSERGALKTEKFKPEALAVKEESVTYKGITATKIIFCEGIEAMENKWFRLLPFSAVKGEALVIYSEELTNEHIFKKGLMLAPLGVQHTFWVGSNYQWSFENGLPTNEFLTSTTAHLKAWLKVPFKVLFHKAALRPATIERRPFVGFHPVHSTIGILNGMGTKGTSLALFFAHQLAQHLVHGTPLMKEVDIARFARILSQE